MTVGELINDLMRCDLDAEAIIANDRSYPDGFYGADLITVLRENGEKKYLIDSQYEDGRSFDDFE